MIRTTEENGERRSAADRKNILGTTSVWKGNIMAIGALILLMQAYLFWQIRYAEKTFMSHVHQDTRMIADVIKLNADTSVLSQDIVAEIMTTFLGNSARFIDYLDSVEPFSREELTALAAEAGLSGIRIITPDGAFREGPDRWFPGSEMYSPESHRLHRLKENHLYFLNTPRAEEKGSILLGLSDARIDLLEDQISLPRLLDMISRMAGIRYARIETGTADGLSPPETPDIRISVKKDQGLMEARLVLGKDLLIVGLEASHFFIRVDQLWNEFFVFSGIFAALGAFFSWLLYRYQRDWLNQVRNFERRLAVEKENAALGRASATITHEVRNPLNAISMGLQRLQIEADELNDEHRALTANILKAVKRTDGIISELKRYSRPLVPRRRPISPDSIIRHVLDLYSSQCDAASVKISYTSDYRKKISGDSDLITEVVENLIKNSIEAQPDGGYIDIRLSEQSSSAVFSVENSGFQLSEEDAVQILEPYYTSKTRGSGLGLAIAGRIVSAHGGGMDIAVPEKGVLRITVSLPEHDA